MGDISKEPKKETILDLVAEFNSAFGIKTSKKPTLATSEDYKLKFNLLKEELDEYLQACKDENLVEVSDAIIDMFYVLSGIVLLHGIQHRVPDMFLEVHNSNMSKLENGKILKRADGKIIKGSEYFKPNLKKFIDG